MQLQLEAVLATRLKWLKKRIAQLYLEELKRFDHTRDRIDRLLTSALGVRPPLGSARSAVPPSAPYGQEPYSAPYGNEEVDTEVPRVDGEFWQPYIFDTGVGNRRGNN